MTGQQLLLIGLLCAISVACASKTEKITESRNYNGTFLCDGSQRVLVRFTPFKAELEFQSAIVEMVQQPASAGLLYTADGQSLRTNGGEATWIDGRGAVHHCRDVTSLNGHTTSIPAQH